MLLSPVDQEAAEAPFRRDERSNARRAYLPLGRGPPGFLEEPERPTQGQDVGIKRRE